MTLTAGQTFIIICMLTLGTVITRFLPFVLFRNNKKSSSYITYLGKVLPYASIAMLVVYCLKEVNFTSPANYAPEAIAIIFIVVLHHWKNNTLLSIGAGTAVYMFLVQTVF
jgi:branched-subunit amino acid transport protein AzlD